jgi:hypothetical protein
MVLWAVSAAIVGSATACTLTVNHETAPAVTAAAPQPPSPVPSTGWETITTGIEWRESRLPRTGLVDARATFIRLDPASLVFRVHYSPGDSKTMSGWRDILDGAYVIVNAAFFDETDHALGLLVSNGQAFGQSFVGFGGMFQVDSMGAVRVRSLVSEPYREEALVEVVQAFPLLIEAGGILAPRGDGFDVRSRRTVIAQDRSGRIVFVILADDVISLAELQDGLLASDLDLHVALALDGGRSTGMDLWTPDTHRVISSLDRLPSVIAVYPR